MEDCDSSGAEHVRGGCHGRRRRKWGDGSSRRPRQPNHLDARCQGESLDVRSLRQLDSRDVAHHALQCRRHLLAQLRRRIHDFPAEPAAQPGADVVQLAAVDAVVHHHFHAQRLDKRRGIAEQCTQIRSQLRAIGRQRLQIQQAQVRVGQHLDRANRNRIAQRRRQFGPHRVGKKPAGRFVAQVLQQTEQVPGRQVAANDHVALSVVTDRLAETHLGKLGHDLPVQPLLVGGQITRGDPNAQRNALRRVVRKLIIRRLEQDRFDPQVVENREDVLGGNHALEPLGGGIEDVEVVVGQALPLEADFLQEGFEHAELPHTLIAVGADAVADLDVDLLGQRRVRDLGRR